MAFQDWISWALSALVGVWLPLTGWAVRTHLTVVAHERRLAETDVWRSRREDSDARVAEILGGVRVEMARLATLQGEMREALRRLEERGGGR